MLLVVPLPELLSTKFAPINVVPDSKSRTYPLILYNSCEKQLCVIRNRANILKKNFTNQYYK